MVPLVFLVHPDPPWSTLVGKISKSVDQNGSEWTTLRHFPDAHFSTFIHALDHPSLLPFASIAAHFVLKCVHQENLGVWSKVVLNATGPPRVVVVTVVHRVYSSPF